MVGVQVKAPPGLSRSLRRLEDVRKIVSEAMEEAATFIVQDLQKTTATWKTKVDFNVKRTALTVTVYTTSKVFKWVDQGTPPHDIWPKKPFPVGRLQFQTGYRPKTYPNTIASVSGGSFGPWTAALMVHHPGIKPRNFTGTLYTIVGKRLEDRLEMKLLAYLGKLRF